MIYFLICLAGAFFLSDIQDTVELGSLLNTLTSHMFLELKIITHLLHSMFISI